MRRESALRKVATVRDRLRKACGVLGTPTAMFEAYRIKRAWVFGSVVKGDGRPNDVDILIEGCGCGRRVRSPKKDRAYLRRYGIRLAISPWDEAGKYLRAGMKMVRIHDFGVDGDYGDIAETKVMIYPRDDFTGRAR